MKRQKIYIFLNLAVWLLITLAGRTAAQETIDVEPLLKEGTGYWYQVSYQCSELVPYYFKKGEQDTLLQLLKYWEEQSGVMEPVRRFWMLYQINRKQFDADFINPIVVEDMLEYEETITSMESDTTDWKMWGEPYVSGEFNRFTHNLAVELLQYTDLSDDEWLICLFYSNNFDDFWELIKSGQVAHTHVYKEFRQTFKEVGLLDLHYDAFAGYYSPRKQLSKLGSKVMLGGGVGMEINRVLVDVTLLLRFLQPTKSYVVYDQNQRYETREYVGVYFGVEPAFQLYDWGQVKIDLLSGVAVDLIEAVPDQENPNGLQSVFLTSSNLNVGVACRYYPSKDRMMYIRGQVRYEFAGYNTHGGTDLSEGEALTFRLGVGWDVNQIRHRLRPFFPKD